MEVGGATANAPLTTAEAVQTAAQQAGQNIAPEVANAGIQSVPYQFSPAELEALQSGQEMARLSSAAPPLETTAGFNLNGTMLENTFLNNPSAVTNEMLRNPSITSIPTASPAPVAPPVAEVMPKGSLINGQFTNTTLPSSSPYQLGPQNAGPNVRLYEQGLSNVPRVDSLSMPNSASTSLNQLPSAEPKSSLMRGLDSALDWADKNRFQAATGAYTVANALGLFKPTGGTAEKEKDDGPLSRYKLSPDFKGSTANPANFQYTPRYAEGGGIMGPDSYNIPVGYDEGGDVPAYAKGGNLSDSIEQYQKMMNNRPQATPVERTGVGIYRDDDPDTRSQDAFTAAQIRQSKINKRANMQLPAMRRPTPMGQLNLRPLGVKAEASGSSLDPETAASGGIMHSSLGGYAAGGNPRLLRGPGDGMSDNIPATISGRQPARLADGEFVIPADVVSHLGNGSTEAGAKQLHAMMNKVREARTGNPKQGKNIKPQKYMPKARA
jgi:hypothetical protein